MEQRGSHRVRGVQRVWHIAGFLTVALALGACNPDSQGVSAQQPRGATVAFDSLDGLPRGHIPTREDWKAISEGWRAKLDRRIVLLQRLRGELDNCIGCGCLSLDRCPIYNASDRQAATGPGPQIMLRDGTDILPPVE